MPAARGAVPPSNALVVAQLLGRATDSIKAGGRVSDRPALQRLLSWLRYVEGDYNDPNTFKSLKLALGDVRRPAFYLAIPPALFATVIATAI